MSTRTEAGQQTKPTRRSPRPPMPYASLQARECNELRPDLPGGHRCLLCGLPLEEPAGWVHLSVSNQAIHPEETQEGKDPEDSQGWFPVGPTCARKRSLTRGYVMSPEEWGRQGAGQ